MFPFVSAAFAKQAAFNVAAKLSKCCQNQAQRPEAVTATRWLLATAWKERPLKMNWISNLPQSLSITAAQLLHVNLPQQQSP